jgi:hypothetical protein
MAQFKTMTSGMSLAICVKREPSREITLNMPMIFISCYKPDGRLERLSSRLVFVEADEQVDSDNHIDYHEYLQIE